MLLCNGLTGAGYKYLILQVLGNVTPIYSNVISVRSPLDAYILKTKHGSIFHVALLFFFTFKYFNFQV